MSNEHKDDKATTAPAAAPVATSDDAANTKRAKPTAAAKRSGAGLLALLLILLLAALAAGAWFGWQWLERQKAAYDAELQSQSRIIAELEAQLGRVIETRVAQDEFDTLRDELAHAQSALDERMNQIAGDMETLREAAQGGRRDLIKAEVEYLLRIAADELYLTQDIDTAIHALQAADDRLRQLAEPRYTPVRELINDHLRALGAVNMPDISGMTLKLGALAREVSSLPLRQAQHARAVGDADDAAPADADWWQRLQGGISRLFDKLVVVQRAEPPPPLLTPEEHFFLYRNVELQLAAARAALRAGDVAAYRQSLELAREWLNRFFDRNDPAVQNAIADLTGLLDVSLQPDLPDISKALERFRAIAGNTTRPAGA